ncbi:MAG: DNA-protecting protein DprA [Tissierellia bacterium]|nr:DNA-protecting protein DprA [Tissierellia bacterium]
MKISDREILIWLNSIGVNNNNIKKIISHFGNLTELWEADNKEIYHMDGLVEEAKEKITKNRNIGYIEKLFNRLEKLKIDTITIYDDNYPASLRYIYDSPNVLYIKGEILEEDSLSLAIVGSRKATAYGKWACEKFSRELVDLGVTIVSGLAAGIDTVAHKTAVNNGGRTIGVLGNGIDIVYPKKNISLFEKIVENGAVISEFPLGTPPLPYNFPQRNRIISGLSMGVIVIEAQEKSGSLITAHHALEQGKEVFALPGNINSIYSGGTNKLIKDGAIPLLDIEAIIDEVHELRLKQRSNKVVNIDYSNLSETEIKVIELLKEAPLYIDVIAYRIGADISTINSVLTILELKGIIKELPGKLFTIC